MGKGDNVDYSIEEVRERVKNVIRELKKKGSGSLEEGLNSVRRGWAEELGKLSTGRLQTNEDHYEFGLRNTLHDNVQGLISAIEGGEIEKIKEFLIWE